MSNLARKLGGSHRVSSIPLGKNCIGISFSVSGIHWFPAQRFTNLNTRNSFAGWIAFSSTRVDFCLNRGQGPTKLGSEPREEVDLGNRFQIGHIVEAP